MEPTDELAAPTSHEKQMEAAITIAKIRNVVAYRADATDIFDLKLEGFTAKEIQEVLEMPEQVYAAAVKWIDRAIKREGFRR